MALPVQYTDEQLIQEGNSNRIQYSTVPHSVQLRSTAYAVLYTTAFISIQGTVLCRVLYSIRSEHATGEEQ